MSNVTFKTKVEAVGKIKQPSTSLDIGAKNRKKQLEASLQKQKFWMERYTEASEELTYINGVVEQEIQALDEVNKDRRKWLR